jgi:hypothetical protein
LGRSGQEKTTKLHLHVEKLTETVLHLNFGHFVGFFLFCAVLFCFPFDETMTELRNFIAFEPGDFLYFLFFYFLFLFFHLFIFNPFSVSLMPVQLTVD